MSSADAFKATQAASQQVAGGGDASMPTPPPGSLPYHPSANHELAALDLSSLLGGPLTACVRGMALGSKLTVQFIKQICFTGGGANSLGSPVMLDMQLDRSNGLLNTKARLHVPFMTLVTLPFIRLSRVEVELNIKISSVYEKQLAASQARTNLKSADAKEESTSKKTDTGDGREAEEEASTTASFVGITTTQETTASGATVKKEHSLSVIITAVQDELPEGMQRLLDIVAAETTDRAMDPLGAKMISQLAAMPAVAGAAPPDAADQLASSSQPV
eukprot:CAMPEP_0177642104 /NCGR_PEP_ID=MMETSP0447-20121125/7412_1 /TAXON_ID=0 /ORGANISM="Stygamoeba regulata, Strain BSH-02190019" /LENGTH=274 /DNA_ID=CAMNT_0019144247 /DNA_START=48 /DNA_END=872 /DNA_ORIENTATION=+